MLRSFPDSLVYDQKLQDTDHAYLFSSEKALGSLAENYVGLPF
jgi:p-hydroxybenzoate 3-monooxygenase